MISRHEIKCNLEDILKTTKFLLKDNGEFYMVHRPERLVDIMYLMRKYNIEPKVLRMVCPSTKVGPKLLLIKGVKNGKNFLRNEKPLYIYDDENNYTKDLQEIYHKGEGK